MEVEGTNDLKRKREDSGKTTSNFLKNYSNFTNSLLPRRVLAFEDGVWTDVDEGVVGLVQEGFQMKKAVFEVEFRGGCSLLDFLLMVMVDLKTGFSRAIAWVDEGGKCYFPVTDCECSPVRLEPKRLKSEINSEGLASDAVVIKDKIQDRMGKTAKGQLEHVETKPETTNNVKVPYAWKCTSEYVVSKTMAPEPWFIEQPKLDPSVDTDFDPSSFTDSSSSSYTRASYYDDDENSSDGEVSTVTSISSVDSSGVYDQTRDTAMTSKDEYTTSKFTDRSPRPIKMSFSTLFGAIEDKVSYRAMKLLYTFYDEHKNNKISRDEFVGRIKQTVRDNTFLLTTIKNLQGKQALATSC